MFDEKGQIVVSKEDYETDPDEFMMTALDFGAEDFQEEDEDYIIITDPNDFPAVRDKFEENNIPMADASVTMIPQNYVTLDDATDIANIQRILEFLDDDDDVQEVFHNWDDSNVEE